MPKTCTLPDGYVKVGDEIYPVVVDENGTHRFVANPIVRYLLDNGDLDLNKIAIAYQRGEMGTGKDVQTAYAEFNMMLGYSVCGFAELSSFMDMPITELSETEALAEQGEA